MKTRFILISIILSTVIYHSCVNNTIDHSMNKHGSKAKITIDIRTKKGCDSSKKKIKKEDVPYLTKLDTLFEEIETGNIKVDFHGIWTEPFWDIYLIGNKLLFVNLGVDIKEIYSLKKQFNSLKKTQKIICTDSAENEHELIIESLPGSDRMSERIYPYTVIFKGNQGAGDKKLMTNWGDYETNAENK